MAKGADFPRRPRGANPPQPHRRGPGDVVPEVQQEVERVLKQQREQGAGDLKPSEELVADAGMRVREAELTAELEQAREEEAAYEDRYGMTFDEFQGAFDPRNGEDIGEDYLAWLRAAERVRMLRYELERLASRPPRRGRRKTPAPDEPDDAGEGPRRGPVS